ncbi:MAG: iron hydrogenase small subunit [Clostridiales bacterium]|nr:iron hydrogenase small subunit [Clostridiales bacterium]MBR5938061.1 [FeFe] hydrogenase, group A [Clostridiales bacterium]
MDMVNVTIDGVSVQVPSNYTVLEAAKQAGIKIPTLCYLKDVNEVGACRVCLVEVEKARALAAACVMPVSEGMVVHTNSKKVRDTRKATLEMILSDHNRDCLSCIRNKNCELQTLAEEYGIRKVTFEGVKSPSVYDDKSFSIVRDGSKCVKCGRCVSACKKQGIGVLSFLNRGFSTSVGPAYDISMADAPCIYCGQCIVACPVGALHEKEETDKVWAAIQDPSKHVVMQVAPAVRAAIGEEFGLPIGTRATGKMFAAMKRLGADKVYDTNWGADLTIMEEGTELLNRINNGGVLPMITSCSPGWIRFCEFYYPEFIPNLSTCKSPHEMEGALIKTYYAKNNNIDPKDIVVVSVMPCTSKKTEAAREQLVNADGLKDVDIVITTRELARMIREAGMDFNSLPDEGPDQDLMGEYTGAAVIFGATGGVMEAAVRTVADILEEKDLPEFEYKAVRGVDADIKEAELTLGGKNIRVAVAHSTAAARKLLDAIKDGSAPEYTFIEIMGCSGGCVCGGGQPQVPAQKLMDIDIRAERAKALYEEDEILPQRKSHKNSQIDKLYKEFLGAPNGHLAHELLHTTYAKREIYPDSVLEE